MHLSNKGISPLLSTVVLLVMSISLGAIVMTWGEEFLEDKVDVTRGLATVPNDCASVAYDIIALGGEPQLCYRADGLDVWLENSGTLKIASFSMQVVGLNDVISNTIMVDLEPEQSKRVRIPYDALNLGAPRQLRLIPKLAADAVCKQKTQIYQNIRVCT